MLFLQKRTYIILLPILLVAFSFFSIAMQSEIKTDLLNRAIPAQPESIDPQKVQSNPAINVVNDLFEGLVTRNHQNKVIPAVACRWDISDDDTVYTFHLCDTKWSDGTPLSANDFVFAWRRAVNPQTASPYAWFPALAGIKNARAITTGKLLPEKLGVTALDRRTLRVTLERSVPWLIQLLSQPVLFPVPEHTIRKYGSQWLSPEHFTGNGAYVLKERAADGNMLLSKNPLYRDAADVAIKKVRWLPVSIESTALHWFESGRLDISPSVPSDSFKQYEKRFPDEIFTMKQAGTEYIVFNTRKAPFDNKLLRQALSYAIDRQVITRYVLGQGQIVAKQFTPPYLDLAPDYTAPYANMTSGERIALARKLYKEAGYSLSKPLSITLLYNTESTRKKMILAIAHMWKENLGVHVRLENMEWKVLLDHLREGHFQVARASWIADYDEASSMLGHFSGEQENKAGYHSKIYDDLFEKVYEATADKRQQLYKKMETILADDMPIAPIYYYVSPRFVSKRVQGYYASSFDQVKTRYLRIQKNDHASQLKSEE